MGKSGGAKRSAVSPYAELLEHSKPRRRKDDRLKDVAVTAEALFAAFGSAEEAWRRILRRRHCAHASVEDLYRAWLPKMTISQVGILLRALDQGRSGRVSLQTFLRTLAPGCRLQDGLDALRQAAQRMDNKSLGPMPEEMTAEEFWMWGKSWMRDERECASIFRLVGQKRRIEKAWLVEWLDALALEVAEPSIYQKIFDEDNDSDESTSASTSVYEEWPPKPSPRLPRAASAPTVGVRRVVEAPLPEEQAPPATPQRELPEAPPLSELHEASEVTPNPIQ